MKCLVVGQHLKVVSKAVRLLSKYADSVTVLTKDGGLIFQTVNDSKSAFVEVIFEKSFFAVYENRRNFECKIDIKSLLLVFRIINLDRIVENCRIIMDSSLPKISFEMKCKNRVFREYDIPYMESEVIKCSRISEQIPNPSIRSVARTLSDLFKYFAQSTKEATIWMFDNHVRFKTFIENDDQHYYDLPSTSFSYVANEFTNYHYSGPLNVTFNVRDTKAFLDFALYQNQLVSVYFQSDSRPIEFIFQNKADNYSSRIILSTFDFPESEAPVPPPFNARTSNNNRSQNTNNSSINESLRAPTETSIADDTHDNVVDDDDTNDVLQNETNETNEIEISAENTRQDPNPSADFQSSYREMTDEDDNNIEAIIANLQDYSQPEEPDAISLTGTQLNMFQRRYLFGEDEDLEVGSDISHYVSDSDQD